MIGTPNSHNLVHQPGSKKEVLATHLTRLKLISHPPSHGGTARTSPVLPTLAYRRLSSETAGSTPRGLIHEGWLKDTRGQPTGDR